MQVDGIKVYTMPLLQCPTGLRARLLLADGTAVEGCGFGAPVTRVGEVVFTTAMTGYPESLTDPSYRGQILIETHPMIGNYGVPSRSRLVHGVPLDYESDRVHVEGFIVAELPRPSHYASVASLHAWLAGEGVPGIYRVDTRFLVERIREHGVIMGIISVYPSGEEAPSWRELEKKLRSAKSYDERLFALEVSPSSPIKHAPEARPLARVSVLDCGLKYGILRRLLERRLEVTRYPCNAKADALIENYDGIVIGNGPGNPALLKHQARVAAEAALSGKPVLAICLGAQLLALGLGAETYKLPYGHRGVNKPVAEIGGGKRCMITTHNHGYAVSWESLAGTGLVPWFRQPDDGTLEGFRSKDGMVIATQFHPEAGPGPWDSSWIFDMFVERIRERAG